MYVPIQGFASKHAIRTADTNTSIGPVPFPSASNIIFNFSPRKKPLKHSVIPLSDTRHDIFYRCDYPASYKSFGSFSTSRVVCVQVDATARMTPCAPYKILDFAQVSQ